MISKLHERLGTAGFVLAVVALIAALAGTAFAAAGLNGKQKKEVKEIAKQFAGKAGAPGGMGPQGPVGPQGPKGNAGSNGASGTDGTDGTSPVGTKFTGPKTVNGVSCTEGGIEFKGASTDLACNGVKGTEGDPWTAGGTLPSEATETGVWTTQLAVGNNAYVPVSFPIPLEGTLDGDHAVVVGEGGTPPSECDDGEAPPPSLGHPEAQPGFLCIFVTFFEFGGTIQGVINPETGSPGAASIGAVLAAHTSHEREIATGVSAFFDRGLGTYAVTAE
jgi:hypothetical protein